MYILRQLLKATLSLFALTFIFFTSLPVANASMFSDLLVTGVEVTLAKQQFQYYDNTPKGKAEMLADYKKQVGVSSEPAPNEMLGRISNTLLTSIKENEKITTPYSFFVTPDKSINAFCGLGHNIAVNQGTFDKFNNNEDEIAFIVAHEIGHGQGHHLVNSFNKKIPLFIAAKLYDSKNDNNMSRILLALTMNQIIARGFTLPNEWDADNRSFHYAVTAGYNPGGGAAAFVRMKSYYGDSSRSFFGQLLSPNDHPTQPQRIQNFSNQLTAFSNNHVKIINSSIMVNDQLFMQPTATKTMLAQERAFLIAGNLSRVFHEMPAPTPAYVEDGIVKIDQYSIVEPTTQDEEAEGLAQTLNFIFDNK